MFSRLREPFGKAGLIVAIVALVAALVGGAYAASASRNNKKAPAGLNSKQKTEVKKIAQSFQGTGPAGPQGPAGAGGKDGSDGAKGDKGDPGNNGVSVTTKTFAGAKGSCKSGGVEVSSSSPTVNVCNGETGFTETLPSEKTETGTWAYGPVPTGSTSAKLPISFPIPLEAGTSLAYNYIGLVENPPGGGTFEPGSATPECPGTVKAPAAAPGNLCVFAATGTGTVTGTAAVDPLTVEGNKAGAVGAVVTYFNTPEKSQGRGDWAATAP